MSDLWLNEETDVEDVLAFLEERLSEPLILDDVVVFNFHSKQVKSGPFLEWADEAEGGLYVIPYQVPGVWGFMRSVLPDPLDQVRILMWRADDGEYVDYPQWSSRHVTLKDRSRLSSVTPYDRFPEDVSWVVPDA